MMLMSLVICQHLDIAQMHFNYGTKNCFEIVDVGGSTSICDCVNDAAAVIFVASLSCYDDMSFGNMKSNSMSDQLRLFDDIVNDQSLSKAAIILFLNKRDLFAEKIKRVPLTKCKSFDTFRGDPNSFDETSRYIREAFTSLNKNLEKRTILTHITCATDSGNIEKVFSDVLYFVTFHGQDDE